LWTINDLVLAESTSFVTVSRDGTLGGVGSQRVAKVEGEEKRRLKPCG